MSAQKNLKRAIRSGVVKTCLYCGSKEHRLTVDHIVPKCLGGGSTSKNLAAVCDHCNRAKGDLLLPDFIRIFRLTITKEIASLL